MELFCNIWHEVSHAIMSSMWPWQHSRYMMRNRQMCNHWVFGLGYWNTTFILCQYYHFQTATRIEGKNSTMWNTHLLTFFCMLSCVIAGKGWSLPLLYFTMSFISIYACVFVVIVTYWHTSEYGPYNIHFFRPSSSQAIWIRRTRRGTTTRRLRNFVGSIEDQCK